MTYSIKRGLAAAGAVLMLCAMGGCGRDPEEKPSSEASNALTTTQPTEKAADTPTEGNTTAGTSSGASMNTAASQPTDEKTIPWDDLLTPQGTTTGNAGTTKAGGTTAGTGKTTTTAASGGKTTAAQGDIVVGKDPGGNWGALKE